LPSSPAALAIVGGEPAMRLRLATGGDDYELLFAAPADAAGSITALSSRLGVPIARIGRIEPGAGVRLVDADGRAIAVNQAGYRHF
jgi:thiamine-monophosphate kinase